MKYLIAIDGGGTGCRAIFADSKGTTLGYGVSGPANISAEPDTALTHIREASERAVEKAGYDMSILHEVFAVLGLAGANAIADRQALQNHLPFGQSKIVSDIETALQGALGDDDGTIIIVGTGSAFVKRKNGALKSIGGRGSVLSDHAGGAWLGKSLLEETLLACDGMAEQSDLINATLTRFDDDLRQIIAFSRVAKAVDYAAFAPLVFAKAAKGDICAQMLLKRACDFIRRGLNAIDAGDPGPFTMTGGLATSYVSLPFLPHRSLYTPPKGDSLQGALTLAMRESASY